MRCEHNRLARNLHHWHQRLERIDGHLVDMRITADVLDLNQHRVAVRRAFCDMRRADHAARAGAVLDDHRLPERVGELRRHHARDLVRRPARRRRHHDADDAVGIIRCRLGGERRGCEESGCRKEFKKK